MKAVRPTTLDFETKAIQRRPEYPPTPVGFSILPPNRKTAHYYAWGHPTENNCDIETAARVLEDLWASDELILCHHAKFDIDVACEHFNLPMLPWERVHDTMYLLFLDDPHAPSFSLKPAAERILGMLPEERDAVADWLVQHQDELMANGLLTQAELGWTEKGNPRRMTPASSGAYISLAPGKLVAAYANGDVIRTRALFNEIYPRIRADEGMNRSYDRERELMPILIQNEQEGMLADVRGMRKDKKMYNEASEKADQWLRKQLKSPDLNIDSDDDLAEVLDAQGIVTDWTYTPTGLKSTSKKNLTPAQFNGAKGKRIASALGYRNRLGTCIGTFMDTWLGMAEKSNGLIYTNWNQVRQYGNDGGKGTRTGRLSSNPNFQNVPKDFYDKNDGYVHPEFLGVPELPLMRKYLLPDKGGVFCHRDYSQQEYRILAHYEDGLLLEGYNEDPTMDMHEFVKAAIKDLAGLSLERRLVKIINFGILYGMGMDKLARDLGCSVEEAKFIKAAQRKAIPGLADLEKIIKTGAKAGEPIRTWGGRLYYTEDPKMINGRMQTFEYKLLNYLIQGSAADCTKEALIRYHKEKRDSRFLVTVHDEINISAPKKAVKQEMQILRDVMASVEFDVPMRSDGKSGPNWGSLAKYKEAA